MQHSMTRTLTRPQAGFNDDLDDIESEDEAKGYEDALGTLTLSRQRAQHGRRADLAGQIAAGASCATLNYPSADDWFRADGEDTAQWDARRTELLRVCAACPVMEACREAALRDGDGNGRQDDMVRGGLSGTELHLTRQKERDRISTAVKEDERADRERCEINAAHQQLSAALLSHHDSRTEDRANRRIRTAAKDLAILRTARRARTGWGEAA